MSSMLLYFIALIMLGMTYAISDLGVKEAVGESVQPGFDDNLAYSVNLTSGLNVGDKLLMDALIPSTTEPKRIITHWGCTRVIRMNLVVDEYNIAHQLTLCFADPDPFVKLGSKQAGNWLYTTGSDMIPFEPYLATGKAFTLTFSMWNSQGLMVELLPASGTGKRHYWWTNPPDITPSGARVRRLDVWESNAHIEVKRTTFKPKDVPQTRKTPGKIHGLPKHHAQPEALVNLF